MPTTNRNLLLKATVLALCVISFVQIFLFPLYESGGGRQLPRTLLDFEESLCESGAKQGKARRRAPCPQYGIVTAVQGGRLGNQMWQYASVWAFARRTGLEPYVPRCIRLKLDQIFDSLTVPTFEEISHCPVDLGRYALTVLALCVTSFVQIFLFPLYESGGGPQLPRTLLDFEESLCESGAKQGKARRRAPCPQYGIVTAVQGGRLGNQMWQYASVWAFARRTGLEPYVPRCIRLKLDQIFDSLTVPTFEEISHCPVDLGRFVRSLDAWNYTNQSIIVPRFEFQQELVITWVQDIIQEFTFKKKLLDKSQQILHVAAKNVAANRTFVGVHIRRKDYLTYLMKKYSVVPADQHFVRRAMRHFERHYPRAVFVIVSDDPLWCIKHFGHKTNVHVPNANQMNSPALDLAILAACNHSIFDYGTFGQWGAILAGGETIFYNGTQDSVNLGKLLKSWHSI